MMRHVVRTSMRYRFLVIAAAVGLMMIGLGRLPAVPVDVFPEFAPPRVEVQTISLGMSSAEVESLVTVPLEQALAGVEGLDILRSTSVPQLSSIELIFSRETDLLRARQLVAERIATVAATLPTWASPPFMIAPISVTARTVMIGLSSDTVSLMDLSMVSYWTIRTRLLSVPGVANVLIWGERLKQLQVQVIPEQMAARGVTLDGVMDGAAAALDAGLLRFTDGSLIGTGGFVDTVNQRIVVQNVPTIVTADSLTDVMIDNAAGEEIPLADVARLVPDFQPLVGDALVNDRPGIMLIVEKFPWANTLEVTRGVDRAIEELRPGLVGIEMDTSIFRPATFITTALDNLVRALLVGSILVFLIIVLFLFDWRTALISLVAIPLSLMAAIVVIDLRGLTLNTLVIAGLVISVGVVVDDAIIDVENIVRRLRQHRLAGSTRSTASIILESSLEVRSAIIYATLIDIVAIMPVFFLEGLSGAFFQPLVVSYGLAVLASLAVALTVTPAMALILLRDATVERRASPIARLLQRGYERLLTRIVRTARPAFITVGAITLVGGVTFTQLGQSLLPDFKERDFLMYWATAPGTSAAEEMRISTRACAELRTIPGIRNCGSHIGQAFQGDEVHGIDFGENWVSVDPSVDYDATVASLQEVVDGYPGLLRNVQTYLKERIREVLTGTSDAIVIRIYGPDLEVLRSKAAELEQAMSEIPGIVDLQRERQVDIAQVEVEVDLAKALQSGVKPGDVRRAVSVMLAGEEVGDIFVGGKAYDVMVWTTPEVRQSVDDIENLPIDTPVAGQVRLGDLADVRVAPGENSIGHEQLARRMEVSANVRGRDLGSVVRDVEAALATVELPPGYYPEMIGEYAERQAAQERLTLFAVVALIGIFMLLQASFGTTRLALLSFMTLPSALVGGVLAAWVGGSVVSLGSLIGFLTVLGIAARNGIMMINHFQHLERYENEPLGPSLVIRGARERLSPILMTASATGLALVPLAVAGNLPGHEIESPMAIVILGGLVTSTLLNLFVVPSLYLRFARRERPVDGPGGVPVAA